MKIKLLVLALLSFLIHSVYAESNYDVFTYWVRGPVRTNTVSSPDYDQWSTNEVMNLYKNMTLTDNLGHSLTTEMITQPASTLTNQTLHLVVRIVGKNGAKVALNNLRFSESSSDSGNTMANSYSLVGAQNIVYSPRALGITYGSGGARVNDTIDTTSNGSAFKDEIVFIGMQSVYYVYTSAGNLAQINDYMTRIVSNYQLTGLVEVVNTSDNTVLGHALRVLMVSGAPVQPILSITSGANNTAVISSNIGTNQSAILYSTSDVGMPVWSVESTINSGDTFTSSGGNKFFRLQLQ